MPSAPLDSDPIDTLLENYATPVSITSAAWEKGTSLGPLKTRSAELCRFDKALEKYHERNEFKPFFDDLKFTFDAWLNKGSDAPRVRTGMELVKAMQMQILRTQESYHQIPGETALDALTDLERTAIKELFLHPDYVAERKSNPDATPTFRRIALKDDLRSGLDVVIASVSLATSLEPAVDALGSSRVLDKPMEPVPVEFTDAWAQVFGSSPRDLFTTEAAARAFCSAAKTVLSYVGNPIALVAKIGLACKQVYDRNTIKTSRSEFRTDPGAGPKEAMDGLVRLIDKELKGTGTDVGKLVAGLGLNVAIPAVGTAFEAVCRVMLEAHKMAAAREEMAIGQQMLNAGKVGPDLFQECPLFGCYFLAMADTSVLLNWAKSDITNKRFVTTIEQMRKAADPAIEKARSFILASDHALEGTEGFKGIEWVRQWQKSKMDFVLNLLDTKACLLKLNDKKADFAAYVNAGFASRRISADRGDSATAENAPLGDYSGVGNETSLKDQPGLDHWLKPTTSDPRVIDGATGNPTLLTEAPDIAGRFDTGKELSGDRGVV